jgi:H+-transporting ATPase
MAPIGWGWAIGVWGYALIWFLINDQVKLLAYKILDEHTPPLLTKKHQLKEVM